MLSLCLVVVLDALYTKRRIAAWRALAAQLKLAFINDTPRSGRMLGMMGDESVEVGWEIGKRGVAGYRFKWTTLRVSVRGQLPLGLCLAEEGIWETLTKLAGARDVQLGEPRFDELFVIRAIDEQECQHYFADPRRRAALLALRSLGLSWWLEEGALRARSYGLLSSEKVEAALLKMVEAARQLHAEAR
jgi:hypothetical protein